MKRTKQEIEYLELALAEGIAEATSQTQVEGFAAAYALIDYYAGEARQAKREISDIRMRLGQIFNELLSQKQKD